LAALFLAFQLELDNPYSAAVTVLIVANPVHGMVWSKSLYRMGGTLIGAAVSILLMGLFAQAPEMFMLGLSLWMGVCAAVSTLLRNFRSYGAILAGYTVVLITMPASDNPLTLFDLVVARVSVVAVGIACSALVSSLLTTRAAQRRLQDRFRAVLQALTSHVAVALSGGAVAPIAAQRAVLTADISGLTSMIEFAAAETGDGARLSNRLGAAVMAMLGTVTTASSLHAALLHVPADSPHHAEMVGFVDEALTEVRQLFEALAAGSEPARLDHARARLSALGQRIDDALPAADLPALVALDRLHELLDELALGIDGLSGLTQPRIGEKGARIRYHLDWRWAGINGLRATVAVWLAGALWFLTAWPGGGMMVAMIVPSTGLLSLRDRPDIDATNIFKGTILASAVGLVWLGVVLPQITGFPLLAMVLAPLLFCGTLAMATPRTAFFGVGFSVFVFTLLAPTNPMHFDMPGFLNSALATMAGGGLTTVVYRLVLPVDQRGHVKALIRAISGDVQGLLTARVIPHRQAWESRMQDRLLRLSARLRAAGLRQNWPSQGAFAALRIGREILRARRLLALVGDDPAVRAVVAPSSRALRGTRTAPQTAVLACQATAEGLLHLAEREDARDAPALTRAAAAFLEIALLLGRHRRFFQAGRA
jgi:uncharacterized membrane protein YccC